MAAPLFSVDDYTAALQALLPLGRAWPRDPDATMTQVMKGLAAMFNRTNARANALVVDAFPATAVELLPEWIATLGIPGPNQTLATTVPGRQQQVVAKFSDSGGQSIAYFVALLASIGVTATIAQFKPQSVRMAVNAPIYGDNWAFSWRVDITGASNPSAEALVRLYAPAHTVVAFAYH